MNNELHKGELAVVLFEITTVIRGDYEIIQSVNINGNSYVISPCKHVHICINIIILAMQRDGCNIGFAIDKSDL